MREMTLEEAKKVELDILKKFASFCDEKGLRYTLAFGTLIGAVRHKGFIPWDDDIDVLMPRKDYNVLMETFNKEVGGRYHLISPYDPVSRHSFIKLIDTKTVKVESRIDYSKGNLGVDLDVFPLDGVPEQGKDFDKWVKKLSRCYRVHSLFIFALPKTLKGKAKLSLIKLLWGSKEKVLKKAAKLHDLYPYEQSRQVSCLEGWFNTGICFEKEWFDETIEAQFEDSTYPIPKAYDQILTAIYGDYMTPPPKEKQFTHHIDKAYFLED